MPNVYSWDSQIAIGERGVQAVMSYLRQHGYHVDDVTNDKDWQARDIDLLVRGKRKKRWRSVEVKVDSYVSGNVYLELVSSYGRPGCVFKSRADVWCYWLSSLGILLLIDLPALQLWLLDHSRDYKRSQVTSIKGNARWSVQGIAVPYETLVAARVAVEVRLECDLSTEKTIQAA
jgi:hypothetical protein